MNTFLVILIVILAIMAVVSLVRGVIAFLQTTKVDLENGGENSPELQLKQNQMMFARIKYQAMAIIAVGVLLAINS